MKRFINGDASSGHRWFKNDLCNGMSYTDYKKSLLRGYGIAEHLIKQWDDGDHSTESYGHEMEHVLSVSNEGLGRMSPDGITRLGLYSKSIGDILSEFPEDKTSIIDYGCGPWPDASQYFSTRLKNSCVKLVDICELPLDFASYQLNCASVNNQKVLVEQGTDSSELVGDDTALIVECTSFEHVVGIRHLFPKMMEALPTGSLFLTNYTRLDWTNPIFDGFQENKDFAPSAVEAALDLAYRFEWNPVQPIGEGWDIWERM